MKKLFFFITTLSALSVCVNGQNTSPYWSLAGNSNATSSSKLGTTNTVNVRFFTKNLERMRVDTSGRVGIGTTSLDSRLVVNSSSGQNSFRAQVNGSTKLLVDDGGGVSVGSSTTPPVNGLYVSGSVGIGTATPSYKLHVQTTGTAIYGNSTGGYYGILGASTYVGVYGSGTSYGVIGSGSYGVYGGGSSYGVYGSGGTYGVYGSGTSYGVYGKSTSGYGVSAISANSYGLYASNTTGTWGAVAYGGYGGSYGSGATYGVWGTGDYGLYGSGGRFGVWAIGSGYGVYGESTDGNGGRFYSPNGYGIYAITGRADNNWAGVFDGDVYCYGNYEASDKNLKKNIKEFGDAMSIINKLKPKDYEFITEGKLASLNLPRGHHYGLIAQDVELVLPNLVRESAHDLNFINSKAKKPLSDGKEAIDIRKDPPAAIQQDPSAALQKEPTEVAEKVTLKAVNYTELIPIIVKGMQELYADKDKKINDLQQQIDELKAMVQTLSKHGGNTTAFSTAFLKQNSPNPFNTNTIISYYIPNNAGFAQIKITDVKGRVIKAFNAAKGEGQINIRSSELPAGTYNYTLYINNKTADTRQMVLIK